VTVWRAERAGGPEPEMRVFDRLPRSADWQVRELDVQCPACRRQALRVRLMESAAQT
jgi:hypothetical protein